MGHSRLCLVNGTICRIPSGWTSATQYFLEEIRLPNLHYQDYRIIFINKLRTLMFHFRSWAHLYRYISANAYVNPPSEYTLICSLFRWNVPVGLCLHILPGASLSYREQVLGGTYICSAWKRSVFLNVNKCAGFRNEKLGNRQATKVLRSRQWMRQ